MTKNDVRENQIPESLPPQRLFDGWLPVALFVVCLAAAFSVGSRTTRGLAWPDTDWLGVGIDLYRDIASAQTMVDAGYGPDPTYRGERTWYNPLTPGLSAAVSLLTGLPVHVVVTQIGAYANLLAPIALFVLVTVLFDRWTALFSSVGFLFLLPNALPSWVSPTYSPWFLPVSFAQTWFYVAVTVLVLAHRRGTLVGYAAAGVAWGFLFLGHTAPSLVFGVIVTLWLADVMRRHWHKRTDDVRRAVARYGTMVALAMAVSSPLILIIVFHYGLAIRNPEPTAYSEPLLSRGLTSLVLQHLTPAMFIAVVGGVSLLRARTSDASRIMFAWMAGAGAFLFYSYVRLAAKVAGLALPSIVPSFHFFFYLKAAAAVLFGVGLLALARAAAHRWIRSPHRLSPERVALVGAALLVAVQWPVYAARPDFAPARSLALQTAASEQVLAYGWFRKHAAPGDVVLAPDQEAATVVAPGGLKVVAIFSGFSNPYVDLAPRRTARDQMFDALRQGDRGAFAKIASGYGVRFVLAKSPDAAAFLQASGSWLVPEFSGSRLVIFSLAPGVLPSATSSSR